MEKLHIYIRVSSTSQVEEGSSLEGQEKIGRDKALALNLSPVVYKDAGISASHEAIESRPALSNLIDKVKTGEVKHIWVFDMTRLSRNLIAKAKIVTLLKDHKVKLYEGNTVYNFDDQNNVLLYNIVAAVTEYDAELRKNRFQIGALTRRRQGAFLGPITPYGYKKDKDKKLIIVDEEAKNIKSMVDLYLNKQFGSGQIANWLNSHGIKPKITKPITLKAGQSNRKTTTTKVNNLWNPGTILSIFKNTVIKGRMEFKGDNNEIEYADCPAIITEQEWERLQVKMKENKIVQKREDKYMYLLKGLMKCGCCGTNMHGRIKQSRNEFTYRCASKRSDYKKEKVCNARGINIFKLNNLVWGSFSNSNSFLNAIETSLDEDETGKELLSLETKLSVVTEKIQENKGLQKNLRDLLTRKLIDEEEYIEDRQRLKKELTNFIASREKIESNLAFLNERLDKRESIKNHLLKLVLDSSKLRDEYRNLKKEDFLDPKNPFLLLVRDILHEYIDVIVVTWNPDLFTHIVTIKFKLGDTITDYTNLKRDKDDFLYPSFNPTDIKEKEELLKEIINHPKSHSHVRYGMMWRSKRSNTNQ